VARLAGVPEAVIQRADVVLRSLEQPDAKVQASTPMVMPPEIKPKKKVKPIIDIRPTLFGDVTEPEA
jgi:DNA mismatch repair ATPase MutS